MLFHLLKKDFLLVKSYLPLMVAVSAGIPLFILWRLALPNAGTLGFALAALYTVFMLLQFVLLKEYQSPRAALLLRMTPCSPTLMVVSKYVFCLVCFAGCTLIYALETLCLPALGGFSWQGVGLTFLALALLFSLYLPLQGRFGYEKTKMLYFLIILLSPFILPKLFTLGLGPSSVGERLLHTPMLTPLAFILGLALLACSACCAVRINNKKPSI